MFRQCRLSCTFACHHRRKKKVTAIMKPSLATLILICGLFLLASTAPAKNEPESDSVRVKRSLKQLPVGLLDPILPLVKAIVPEPILGKITKLLPLPADSGAASKGSS